MSKYRYGTPAEIRQRHRKQWRRLVALIRSLRDRRCEFCGGPIEIRACVYMRKHTTRYCSRKCSRLAWAERHEAMLGTEAAE